MITAFPREEKRKKTKREKRRGIPIRRAEKEEFKDNL